MSTAIGRLAEAAAADYLRRHGFSVLEQNWRTRWCEIDIVARRSGIVYFVEVKYRGHTTWGSGLEYVTRRKLQQMYFAAHFWIAQHAGGSGYGLVAIELTGMPPHVSQVVRVA